MGTKKFSSYITEDGKSFMYFKGINEDNKPIYIAIPISAEITLEQAQAIIELDHRCYLDDRYYEEAKDALYETMKQIEQESSDRDDAPQPHKLELVDSCSPETILLALEEEDDPIIEIGRSVIEEECSETQQELFYKVFGMCMQLTEIRRELEALTGNAPAESSLSRSVKRIEMKVIKRLENAGIDLP